MTSSVSPVHSIHEYGNGIYKVVTFKGVRDPDNAYFRQSENVQHNDKKLDNNFSRARNMVLQYALCNPWDYFFTGTIDRAKFDRFDLDTYQSRLSQFIRDKRKKYQSQIQVLLVPEHHKDGAWHIHGLISGLPEDVISPFTSPAPQRLIDGGFLNWPDYMNTFGFCSLAPIRDPIATAYYITKYISKDLSRRESDIGKHLYFHSRPLKKATKASDVYLYQRPLDDLCVNEYDFCKIGMVYGEEWAWPYLCDGAEPANELPLYPVAPDPEFQPMTIEPDFEQLKFDGYL